MLEPLQHEIVQQPRPNLLEQHRGPALPAVNFLQQSAPRPWQPPARTERTQTPPVPRAVWPEQPPLSGTQEFRQNPPLRAMGHPQRPPGPLPPRHPLLPPLRPHPQRHQSPQVALAAASFQLAAGHHRLWPNSHYLRKRRPLGRHLRETGADGSPAALTSPPRYLPMTWTGQRRSFPCG